VVFAGYTLFSFDDLADFNIIVNNALWYKKLSGISVNSLDPLFISSSVIGYLLWYRLLTSLENDLMDSSPDNTSEQTMCFIITICLGAVKFKASTQPEDKCFCILGLALKYGSRIQVPMQLLD